QRPQFQTRSDFAQSGEAPAQIVAGHLAQIGYGAFAKQGKLAFCHGGNFLGPGHFSLLFARMPLGPSRIRAIGKDQSFTDMFIFRTSRSASGRSRSIRSEEHTSELQSRENLVCRLLLEKKKKDGMSQFR